MVTIPPILGGHRTRLIDLLGPHSQNAALAEAFAAFLQSRLAEGEKGEILSSSALFADLSLRECIPPAGDSLYTPSVMADVFSAYRRHLSLCDLEPKTKARYWEVVNGYQKWLVNRRLDATTAQAYLAYLRS